MKFKVTVMRNHWEDGKRLSPYRCAVANALSSMLGEVTVCSKIYYTAAGFHFDLEEYPVSKIPNEIIHHMIRFDAGHSFPGEFSFEIDVPEEVIELINIQDLQNVGHLKHVQPMVS